MLKVRLCLLSCIIAVHLLSQPSLWLTGIILLTQWLLPTHWNENLEIINAISVAVVLSVIFILQYNPGHWQNRINITFDTVMQLPQTPSEFYNILKSRKFVSLIEAHPTDWPYTFQTLLKYCLSALVCGRPLNKVMIVMVGETGTGKSTTINKLFADNAFSVTLNSSGLREVIEYGKTLFVTSESPAIEAVLSFVDLPGISDADHKKEIQKLASVKQFYRESRDLAERTSFDLLSKLIDSPVREKVYPNMILMIVKAVDSWIILLNSSLKKNLRMLEECQLLDKHYVNLIIVVTHAMNIPPKNYTVETNNITSNIRSAVYSVLNIRDIHVIFVENIPDDYNIVKLGGSDFYSLPDGQVSHYNLIQAMIERFKGNHDFLGRLLSGWYFHQSCPEKSIKPRILNSVSYSSLSFDEAQEIQPSLFRFGIKAAYDRDICPSLNFRVLGRGYCPRGESLRHISVLRDMDKKQIEILGRNYTVPKYIHLTDLNKTHIACLSWDIEETYANHKKSSYGLDNDIHLMVNVDSRGRWLRDNKLPGRNVSPVSFLYEIRLINLRMDDTELYVRKDLIEIIEKLPDWYDPDDTVEFQEFFNKWGTHFVCEVWIGGSIKVDTFIRISTFSKELGFRISERLKYIFSSLEEGHFNKSTLFDIEYLSAYLVNLTFTGGNPPEVTTLNDLTPQKFLDWIESVKRSPSELQCFVKLLPYYNLVTGRQHYSLTDATIEYLGGAMLVELELTREKIAYQILSEVIKEKKCR